MQQIAEHVFYESSYYGGNIGCVITEQGPILIDTPMFPRDARHWRDQIEQITSLPILYIINTDYDSKRILTNALFDAPVIAHELTWGQVEGYGDAFWQNVTELLEFVALSAAAELDSLELVMPQITFTERMIIEKGSPQVRLIHLGGYTPATIAVHIPEEKVLFTGDNVMVNTLPIFGQADTKQWLQSLTAIRKMNIETLVPGHGPLCDTSATQPLSEYIRLLREKARRHFQAGRSKSELSGLVSGLMDAYPIPEKEREGLRPRIKLNLDRFYDELKALQRKK